jgi:hypothetical protein
MTITKKVRTEGLLNLTQGAVGPQAAGIVLQLQLCDWSQLIHGRITHPPMIQAC